jgi:hypothetical protein
MPQTIAVDRFTGELFDALDETFEHVHGMYLDRGTSLFETLATISAEEASRPVSDSCGTLAAQVEHVRFYLDVLEGHISGHSVGKADWGEIWRTVHAVSPPEWEASKDRLKDSHQRVLKLLRSVDTWESQNAIGGSLAILVHTAYHLGEIRQALCTIKQSSGAAS